MVTSSFAFTPDMLVTPLLLLSYAVSTLAFNPVSFEGCEVSKGCMKPQICSEERCAFMATWMIVDVNDELYVEFELLGEVNSSGGYISIAFSEDSEIGNDGVISCYHEPTSNVVIKAAYTKINSNYQSIFLDVDEPDFLITSGENLGGVFNGLNNVLQCRFRRRLTPRSLAYQLKDLAAPNQYYLILSIGKTSGAGGFVSTIPGGQLVSKHPIVITSPIHGSVSGQTGSPLAKAHGCLMVLAWICFASVGIIMARYYKDVWPNSGLMGERVWFQLHRLFMLICFGLNIIGVILAFAFCNGYSQVTAYPNYIHPILGLIVFILSLINPFLTLCRCHPADPKRPWFNWIHFLIGTFAYVLAVPTMMIGFRMPGAGIQLTSISYPLWILILFIIFQFCIEIILELHGCIYYRRNKDKRQNYKVDLDQYHAAIRLNTGVQPRPPEPEPSGRMFKYFVIGLHATVCAIVSVMLIIIIAVN